MANTNLKVTDLDFDTIKTNLREYLAAKTVFTDYDFEGSALSALLDVLAYNTHYNAYYVNMVANEMFLDSASQRDSVVSIAKHLGYTPKSKSSASATITLQLTQSGSQSAVSVVVPKYEKFEASVDGKTYTFYSMNSYDSTSYVDAGSDRIFTINNVVLKEGTKLTKTFVVNDNSLNAERYLIPNSDIDTSTIVVKVKDSITTADSGYKTYTENAGIKDLISTDLVYFLQEVEDGQYEIFFGDGAYGKQLDVGNSILIEYMVSSGSDANGSGGSEVLGSSDSTSTFGFTPISSSAVWAKTSTGSVISVDVIAKVSGSYGSIASGGNDAESLESIKFTAPINFQAQNRALTANDYKSIILTHYANVDSIRVWGGEDNARPEYGKVFIVVKPKDGTLLSAQNITDIKAVVDTYKPIGVVASVKSPDYLFITINTEVTYNPNIAAETEGTLKNLIIEGIMNYNNTDLATFDSIFRFSKLSGLIDDVDTSISSNKTSIGVRQHKTVTAEQLSTSFDVYSDQTHYEYTVGGAIEIIFDGIDLKSPVNAGTFKSDTFTTLGRILKETKDTIQTVYYQDDGLGNIDLLVGGGNLFEKGVGTIDYATGKVSRFSPIKILSIDSTKDYLKFMGDVINQDLYPDNTQIILFEEIDITVAMKSETL